MFLEGGLTEGPMCKRFSLVLRTSGDLLIFGVLKGFFWDVLRTSGDFWRALGFTFLGLFCFFLGGRLLK